LFGATVLICRDSKIGRAALNANNRRGTLNNCSGAESGLRVTLDAAVAAVEGEVIGAEAIVRAATPCYRSRPGPAVERPG
jgi:hypothetical protein